jgi:dihydroorotase
LAPEKKKAKKTRHSTDQNILVKDTNIWTGTNFIHGSILIENGRIQRIARRISPGNNNTIDASGLYALPGLIDVHVHLRDMKLSYKEDFATGTAAAAAGGFTTVLDMPNTVPPTDSLRRLLEKMRRAERRVHVNVGFHAAASSHPDTIESLAEGGAFSLKLYMPKPIAPFDVSNDLTVRRMMDRAKTANIPVTVHAEDLGSPHEPTSLPSFEQAAILRLSLFEARAVERILKIQKQSGARVHLCHLTLNSSLEKIASAPATVTSEVTPHHLLLSYELLSSLRWKAWTVPPLRSNDDREALFAATVSGSADLIASDHAPHTISEKNRPPTESVPGVPGLETTLRLMLTLVNKRVLTLRQLINLLVDNPAKIFRLKRKARIRPGFDGDLVLIDLKKKSRIDSSKFYSKAKFSPFDGRQTVGAVSSTIAGGRLVYDDGEIVGPEGSGSVLKSDLSD